MNSKNCNNCVFLFYFVSVFSYSQELTVENIAPDSTLSIQADSLIGQQIDSLLLEKFTIYGIAAYGNGLSVPDRRVTL